MTESKNNPAHGTEAYQDNRLDSVLLAIMANRMDAICREMTNTVLFSARSAVIGIARDFSCAIITSDDEVLAVGEALPIHVFGMHLQTASMAQYHPDFEGLDTGEIICCLMRADGFKVDQHAVTLEVGANGHSGVRPGRGGKALRGLRGIDAVRVWKTTVCRLG